MLNLKREANTHYDYKKNSVAVGGGSDGEELQFREDRTTARHTANWLGCKNTC